ncbi:MAG: TIGR00730 family Rossman fold protein [Chloroflexota bacterium]|nr:TIGR00730 family Rossman fold protein [Chloroflexota bacterium]
MECSPDHYRACSDAGVTSIGLSIELPDEQVSNAYTTKSISFSHFFARKVMLVKYAIAFIIMPGGMGTLDELSEVLILMQTHKIKPFPVVLFNSEYWKGLLNWLESSVLKGGYISEDDLQLLRVCDDTDEVIEVVQKWYIKQEVVGRKALVR